MSVWQRTSRLFAGPAVQRAALAGLLVLLGSGSPLPAGSFDKYIWEAPRARDVDASATAHLRKLLAGEVDQVLKAGPLAPLRLAYADIPYEAYWLYYERGRMITTLAWAYPHMNDTRRQAVSRHVADLLANPVEQPWKSGIKDRTDGRPRSLHGQAVQAGRYVDASKCPTLHTLYGLWLWGDRTGQWDLLQRHWPDIRTAYQAGREKNVLYGQMGAHIAVARLARRFNDRLAQALAEAALDKDFATGRKIELIEDRQKRTRYARFYEGRSHTWFAGQPWMFLDSPPEVLRFLNDHARPAVLERIDKFTALYPLWWLHQAPYFTRWTGDESLAPGCDIFGAVYPVERWVRQRPARELAQYFRSCPTGVGDCYWIESLAQTIEAFGTIAWETLK